MKPSSPKLSILAVLLLSLSLAACGSTQLAESPFDSISFPQHLSDGAMAFHKSIFSSMEF